MFLIEKETFRGENTSPDKEILGYVSNMNEAIIYLNQFGEVEFPTLDGQKVFRCGELYGTHYYAIPVKKAEYNHGEMYVCIHCYKVFTHKRFMATEAACSECFNKIQKDLEESMGPFIAPVEKSDIQSD